MPAVSPPADPRRDALDAEQRDAIAALKVLRCHRRRAAMLACVLATTSTAFSGSAPLIWATAFLGLCGAVGIMSWTAVRIFRMERTVLLSEHAARLIRVAEFKALVGPDPKLDDLLGRQLRLRVKLYSVECATEVVTYLTLLFFTMMLSQTGGSPWAAIGTVSGVALCTAGSIYTHSLFGQSVAVGVEVLYALRAARRRLHAPGGDDD